MKKIVTECRECVFAEYEGDHATEKGCVLGRIGKFEERGAKVIGWQDGGVTKFYTINRYCNHCHKRDSPYLKGETREEWSQSIRKHVVPRVAAMIYVDDNSSINIFLSSLDYAREQSGDYEFTKFVVVLDEDFGSGPQLFIPSLRNLTIPWEIVKVEPDADSETPYANSFDRAVDIAVAKLDSSKVTYYSVYRSGESIPYDLIEKLDRAINDELIPVVAVLDGDGYTVMTEMHKHPDISGNKGSNIVSKLPWVTQEYGDHLKVVNYGDLT